MLCNVQGCDREAVKKCMCQKHYMLAWRANRKRDKEAGSLDPEPDRRRLTDKQLEVYCYAREFFKENDQLPPISLVSAHIGLADRTGGYHYYEALEKKGYVERNKAGHYRFARERIE